MLPPGRQRRIRAGRSELYNRAGSGGPVQAAYISAAAPLAPLIADSAPPLQNETHMAALKDNQKELKRPLREISSLREKEKASVRWPFLFL